MYPEKAELGVLLNHSQLLRAIGGRYGFEYLPFYSEAAKKEGANVVFFSPHSVLGKDNLILGFKWNPKIQSYQYGLYELPLAIHNRAFLSETEKVKVASLLTGNGTMLFNKNLRFDKWDVHQVLQANPVTAKYLTDTAPLTSSTQIRKWLGRYPSVYLKPRRGSLGLGVIRLRESIHGVEVSRTVKGNSMSYLIPKVKVTDIVKKIGARPYLIQEGISLMNISGHPVDFRVSVQKSGKGKWTISGIVGKIGQLRAHATNLAVGGTALAAHDLLDPVFGRSKAEAVYRDMKEAALLLAGRVEELDSCLADLGLDLAVTQDGSIKFIEANGRDLRITFRNANEENMWKNTFYNPIQYGLYLLENKGVQNETDFLRENVKHGPGD